MKIIIITVGKIKEKFFADAILEYKKRIGKYCDINIIEVADESTKEGASTHEIELVKDKEGERILKNLKGNEYVFTLEIEGKQYDSISFAREINNLTISGRSNIVFIIGGSLGLSKNVIKRSDNHLSFSKMTFPHQLMRVVLLEQIYRGFRIIHNEPYHK